MKFKELGLSENILKSIEKQGFTEPTEIQSKTIPLVVAGNDVIAQSATGSGKTLAFGAGMLEKTVHGKGIQGLVLTPTRELCEQVRNSLVSFSAKNLNIVQIYGGVSINPQFEALKTADIVVGTPGRVLDHLSRDSIDFSRVKFLVLDEADRMLDMGFIDDVKKIMKRCPKERQTLLFTATLPGIIEKLAKQFMKNPKKVIIDSYVDPKKLRQVYYDVPCNMKISLLVHLLKEEQTGLVMVFCNSRRTVDFVSKILRVNKIDSLGIHGGLTQQKRQQVMDRFNSETTFVLVCTDVAARGLDIPGVSHVYNYDIPQDSKQYIHRIGRTARAGESGMAINLLCDRDHEYFQRVLDEYDVRIVRMEKPFVKKLDIEHPRKKTGFGGRRRSGSGYGRRSGHGSGNRAGSRRPRRSYHRKG